MQGHSFRSIFALECETQILAYRRKRDTVVLLIAYVLVLRIGARLFFKKITFDEDVLLGG